MFVTKRVGFRGGQLTVTLKCLLWRFFFECYQTDVFEIGNMTLKAAKIFLNN